MFLEVENDEQMLKARTRFFLKLEQLRTFRNQGRYKAHSDAFRKMCWTTFRGAIECGNMFITELTLNKTIRYNVKLLASR